MVFQIYNKGYNLSDLRRRARYGPLGYTQEKELNCVRSISGDYPRFHVYLKENDGVLVFALHLDQKKPSYEGTTAHGGDYESEVVRAEADRIKDAILR